MSSSSSTGGGSATEASSSTIPSSSAEHRDSNPFSWMDSDERGPEYVSYSQLSDLPACSFDFGNDGYAASSNYGGELLQMTAPSDDHGLVFARGDFEYSLYLALARGQKERGGKSAFGLKVAPSDELAKDKEGARFRPCCMVERGCFNYRWPFNEFCLHIDQKKTTSPPSDPTCSPPPATIAARSGSNPTDPTPIASPRPAPTPLALARDPDCETTSDCICPAECQDAGCVHDGRISKPVGTFSLTSFIKDSVLYQVLRFNPTSQPGVADKAELILTVEPPMRLQSFRRLNQHNSKEKEVGLKGCTAHRGEACLTGLLPVGADDKDDSDMHWRAQLFKLNNGAAEPTPVKLTRLGKEKEKKDHCFKINDNFDSLPRFQADLQPLDTNTHHVFVAAFHLFEDGKPQSVGSLTPPQSWISASSISDFVRRGEDDAPGTSPLWQTIFNDRQDKMDSVSGLCEGNIVGRCLEKILRVDLVPALIPQWESTRRLVHFTLVSNMFLKANVDLKSLFWKVRFLVKVDHLLCNRVKRHAPGTGPQSQGENDKPMSEFKSTPKLSKDSNEDIKAAEATIRRIRFVIGEIAAYIVRALLEPTPPPVLLPEHHKGDPSHYYAMITLCYLVKHYPMAEWAWHDELNDKGEGRSQPQGDNKNGQTQVKGENWGFGILKRRLPEKKDNPLLCSNHTITKVKYSMLEWLHCESILYLQGSRTGTTRIIPPKWQVSESEIKKVRLMAKTELVRRIASVHVDTYRADDEIADRLGFLGEELFIGPEHETARQLAERITKRVEQREYTRQIDLCRPSRVHGGTDDGPWEVHALCHHSRLVVAHKRLCAATGAEAREEAEMEVEHFRKMFYPFLTSEASLTPCWERNNSSARRGFLRSEATAVLASTIIDIFEKDVEYYQRLNPDRRDPPPSDRRPSITLYGGSDVGGDHLTHHESVSVAGDFHSTVHSRRGNTSSMRHLRRTGERANMEGILIQQLETLEKLANAKGLERQINYLEFRPPTRYHPVEFFNSLDDTPELYDNNGIANREATIPVVIREALATQTPPIVPAEYGSKPPSTPDPLDDLEKTVNKNEETTDRLREILVGRVKGKPHVSPEDSGLRRRDTVEAAKILRQLTVIDLVTPDPLPTTRPRPIRGEDIVRVVSDSLIDQEVRHRFLLALSPYELPLGLLRLLVYVLHPEVVECFKNHRLRVSRFGLSTRPETVVIHITLRSWAQRPTTRRTTDNAPVYVPWAAEKEDDRIHLPPNLRHHAHSLGRFPKDMQLHVSSIGMSTNSFGDFSKCSIISSLIPQNEVDEKLGPLAQQIWDSFTHQPQTGRFLVFSVVLGMLTQAMVKHYTTLVDEFLIDTQLEADDRLPSYLQDPEELQRGNADRELRFSLWCLEALAKLSNTVSTSVTTLHDALSTIASACQIDTPFTSSTSGLSSTGVGGSKLRTPELESAIHSYLSPLERAYSDLTALQTRLSRKVDLSTRYSASLSAILALRASRDSYNQNNTIQKLTYLTIGCLPVGLTAAIFAVPDNQDVINPHTGKGWFIGAVLISFVVIFAVAYWLDLLLGVLRRLRENPKDFLTGAGKRRKGRRALVTGTTFWGP